MLGIGIGIQPQLLAQSPGGGVVPANAIITDAGDAITLDDGTTYVVQD